MFNTQISSTTSEGREGEWKYGYTHSYHRHLTEVRGQPHAQPIYPRLKTPRHTLSRMLSKPDWTFSWRGKPLVPGGTRTPGRQKCLLCEDYGLEGATASVNIVCSVLYLLKELLPWFFVYFEYRSWVLWLQIHKILSSEVIVKAFNFHFYYQRGFPSKNKKTYFPTAQVASPTYLLEMVLFLLTWYF